MKSAIHRQAYLETQHPEDVLSLLNGLSRLFREELIDSRDLCFAQLARSDSFDNDRLRTVSQIQIQHYSKLTAEVLCALKEALDVGLLQRPIGTRQPQQQKQVPHENFKLHRMLCPYYELALANRWPRRIDATVLNDVLRISDAEFVKKASGKIHGARRLKDDSAQQSLLPEEVAPDPVPDEASMEFENDAE